MQFEVILCVKSKLMGMKNLVEMNKRCGAHSRSDPPISAVGYFVWVHIGEMAM